MVSPNFDPAAGLNPASQPNPEYPEKLGVAIGRALPNQWRNHAVETFGHYFHGIAELHPRTMIGIDYVSQEELAMVGGSFTDGGIDKTTQEINDVIAELALGHNSLTPAPTLIGRISMTRGLFRLAPPSSTGEGHMLEARIDDKRDDSYECKFLIEGERRAVRTEVGLPPTNRKESSRQPTPYRWLRIGIVAATDSGTLDSRLMTDVINSKFAKKVQLMPAGAVLL